jgi:hypothetical protein
VSTHGFSKLCYHLFIELVADNVEESDVSVEVDVEVSPVVDSVELVESLFSCCNRNNIFPKPGVNSPLESKKGVREFIMSIGFPHVESLRCLAIPRLSSSAAD